MVVGSGGGTGGTVDWISRSGCSSTDKGGMGAGGIMPDCGFGCTGEGDSGDEEAGEGVGDTGFVIGFETDGCEGNGFG